MGRSEIDDELETLRQFVIAARRNPDVEQPAEESLERLRGLYAQHNTEFRSEDIRWINVLQGFLRERLDALRKPQFEPRKLQPRVRRECSRGGEEPYWARIRASLGRFCCPSDQLDCPRIFKLEGQTCQMCGHWPITWNYVLRNSRISDMLVVGSECIVNYREEMARMEHNVPPVIFWSPRAAKYMNDKCPGIAVVGPIREPDYESYPGPDVHESYED
jgi:hypothetical protein